MNLKDIMVNEINQLQKTNTVWFIFYEVSKVVKFIGIERMVGVVTRGWVKAEKGTYYLMDIKVKAFSRSIPHVVQRGQNKLIFLKSMKYL